MRNLKTRVEELIERCVKPKENEVEVKLIGAMYTLRNSGANLLIKFGEGKISEDEFDEVWSGLKNIYMDILNDAGQTYAKAVEEVVYKGRELLIKK